MTDDTSRTYTAEEVRSLLQIERLRLLDEVRRGLLEVLREFKESHVRPRTAEGSGRRDGHARFVSDRP